MLRSDLLKAFISKKFVKDAGWLLLSSVILAVCGLLINLIISQTYGAEGFGIFSICLKIYLLSSILGVMGASVCALKYSAELNDNRDQLNESLSAAVVLALAGSLLVTVGSVLLAPWLSTFFEIPDLESVLLAFIAALPFFALNKVFFSILNGVRDIKALSLLQSLRWILLVVLIFVMATLFESNLLHTVLAFLITEIIILLFCFIYTTRYFRFSFLVSRQWLKKHLSFGGKSMLSYAIIDLYNSLDVLMLGAMVNVRVAGIYSFAADFAKNLFVIADIFYTNFNPLIAELWAKKQLDELKSKIRLIRKNIYYMYIPITLLAGAVYYVLINYLVKEELTESFVPFLILSMGIFAYSGYRPFSAILEMTGFPGDKLRMNVITLVLNFTLNLLFIYVWGMNGAAIATSLVYVASIVLLNYFTHKRLHIKLL